MTSYGSDRLRGSTLGAAVKEPVRAVSTSNLVLRGLQTIGGVTLVEDDRVLLTGQADTIYNGIWVASETDWFRARDFDGERDVVQGTLILHAGTRAIFRVTTPNPIIGQPIAFAFSGGGENGVGAITTGTTSVVIAHGLPATPAVGQIIITARGAATNDYGHIWIDGISSASFTVNVSADPGLTGFLFGWSCN
jgi:hypothetical protein